MMKSKLINEIPGPITFPMIGNCLYFCDPAYGLDPRHTLRTMAYVNDKYGPMVRLKVPLRPTMVFLFDPYLCEKVYNSLGSEPVRPTFDALTFVQSRRQAWQGRKGLLVSHKEEWKDLREHL